MATRLTDAERASLTQTLPDWSLVEATRRSLATSSSATSTRRGVS